MSNIRQQLRRVLSLLPRSKLAYRACRLYLDICDGDTSASMLYNGEVDFLRKQIAAARPPCTVFDVGANCGMWSREVVSVNPQVTLHGFEPDVSAYEVLCDGRWPTTVRFTNTAVGSERTTQQFHVFGSGNVHNSLYPNADHRTLAKREVAVETLDDYCRDNNIQLIDYLKIDVEGNELAVLRGAARLLREHQIRLVQLEYGDKWVDSRSLLKDLYEQSERFGYHLFKLVPYGKLIPMPPRYDYSIETFRHATIIFKL
jgi:FkbM family methyltransferase